MELKFEELFKSTVLSMRISRSHPQLKKDLKWFGQFILLHGPFTIVFIVAFQTIFINLKAKNITEACRSGVLAVVYIISTFHYSILVWRQTEIFRLMEDMKKDFLKSKQMTVIEQDIVRKYAIMGKYVCSQWVVLTFVGSSVFPIINLVMLIQSWSSGDFHYVPLFDLVYPSAFVEENKDTLLIFVMTYMLLIWFAFHSSMLYIAFVPLGPTFMLHACGQLEIVKSRVDVLFKNDDVNYIKIQLKDMVRDLQYIYGYVDRAKLCFRVVYEVTMRGTVILLPISCYEILESLKRGELSLDFVVFVVGGILIISAPCYYSDLLKEKGEDLCLAIYFCGWERFHDRSIRSTLLVMLQRAQRPVAMQSLFRVVCLDALTDIFQHAYTIFNLLKASTS